MNVVINLCGWLCLTVMICNINVNEIKYMKSNNGDSIINDQDIFYNNEIY